MVTQHLRVINTLVDGIMTKDLGLIDRNKTTPELKESLDVFLSVRQHLPH